MRDQQVPKCFQVLRIGAYVTGGCPVLNAITSERACDLTHGPLRRVKAETAVCDVCGPGVLGGGEKVLYAHRKERPQWDLERPGRYVDVGITSGGWMQID